MNLLYVFFANKKHIIAKLHIYNSTTICLISQSMIAYNLGLFFVHEGYVIMDFFEVDKSVLTSSNVGGFGIDGALSTLLGQSMADRSRLAFGLVGDLAFFYDMNALGNRHVHNRLRILLVNNGRGVEFRLNKTLENQWGSDTDELIAARGHFGSGKGWAESMGFRYMTASDTQTFDQQIEEFCHPDLNHFEQPVLFEVFTDVIDEKQALQNMRSFHSSIPKK